jgi:hypothetical protein
MQRYGAIRTREITKNGDFRSRQGVGVEESVHTKRTAIFVDACPFQTLAVIDLL